MYVCWLVAADVWEVNTEAVFHCWCRVGGLKLQFSTWRRANALAHDDGTFTCHFGVTYVDLHLMGMYVCMFPHWHIAGDRELTWLSGESRVNCSA